MTKPSTSWTVLIFASVAWIGALAGPAQAGDGKMTTPFSSAHFADDVRASLGSSEKVDPVAAIRQIRRLAYRNILFSGVGDGALNLRLQQTNNLQSALTAVEASQEGVWCVGAAVILARLYEELGYKSQIITWGSQPLLSHTQVLVQANGQWYMQDAYFNFDYVDEQGRAMPYFDVLKRFSDGQAPIIRQDIDERIGLFDSLDNAVEYVPPLYQNKIDCVSRGSGVACDVTMTVSRFLESWYQRQALTSYLTTSGLPPDRPDYLMLFPAGASETRRNAPYEGGAEMMSRAKAITQCWSEGVRLSCDSRRGRPVLKTVNETAAADGSRLLRLTWRSLVKSHLASGVAPLDVVTPALAYDYGAVTSPVTFDSDQIIELSLQASKGKIGVALVPPDGSSLISKEKPVTPADGAMKLQFPVSPSMGPVSILLRNYDDQGNTGAVRITEVRSRPAGAVAIRAGSP